MNELSPTQWVELFKGVDIGVMIGIAVIAFVLERSQAVSDRMAILVPLVLGMLWGILEASQNGYGTVAFLLKGALFNGGAASVIARGAQVILAGWWKRTGNGVQS